MSAHRMSGLGTCDFTCAGSSVEVAISGADDSVGVLSGIDCSAQIAHLRSSFRLESCKPVGIRLQSKPWASMMGSPRIPTVCLVKTRD